MPCGAIQATENWAILGVYGSERWSSWIIGKLNLNIETERSNRYQCQQYKRSSMNNARAKLAFDISSIMFG